MLILRALPERARVQARGPVQARAPPQRVRVREPPRAWVL
jgi:hypothetical protein